MTHDLALVRRLEDANLSAWPSETVLKDGDWVIRLTPGHPSRRINSFYALNPEDDANIEDRFANARAIFQRKTIPAFYRSTPLTSPEIISFLNRTGWRCLDVTHVLTTTLEQPVHPERNTCEFEVSSHLTDPWLSSYVNCSGLTESARPALERILQRVHHPVRFIRILEDGSCIGTAAIILDNEWAGLFEIAVHPSARGKGVGKQIIAASLVEAKAAGSSKAWLQVVEDNHPAYAIYKAFGFRYQYDYAYWQPADSVKDEA
ncbi:GNAT family N-acetyltransferase [Coralliovum pocilloporae]|uniref:GNAT family N-acetyltransferase n=1 Tax=Coralliovum pocilloporae TaxID=3066369 RepID=UPI003306F684